MILWNRNRPYKKRLTADERYEIAEQITTKKTIRNVEIANTIINVAVPILLLLIVWNKKLPYVLLILGIAFVITDVILCTIDNLIFVIFPYKRTTNMSLSKAQKRLDIVKAKNEELNQKLKQHYEKCDDCWTRNCSRCDLHENERWDKRVLSDFIKDEEKYINKELEKIQEEEIKADTKKSKDYTDKLVYLTAIGEKLKYFKKSYDMVFLKSVVDSVSTLKTILEKKPIGHSLISSKLYIHLDELINILTGWEGLSDAQKDIYMESIKSLSEKFTENINHLVKRIEKLETENIEVSISVLMKELTDYSEKENVE